MIDSSQLSKGQFVRVILDRDLRNIFKAQLLAVRERRYLKGKDLKVVNRRKRKTSAPTEHIEEALVNPNYIIQSQGETFIAEATIPIDMRFYDMRGRQNMQIYNRIVWGILFNNALPDIRFGYGQQIHDIVGRALHRAMED